MIAMNRKSHQRGFGFGSDMRCWRWWSLNEGRTKACVRVRDAGFFCALIESNRLYRGRKCNLQSLQMGQCPTRPHKPGLSGATPESATFRTTFCYGRNFVAATQSHCRWASAQPGLISQDRQVRLLNLQLEVQTIWTFHFNFQFGEPNGFFTSIQTCITIRDHSRGCGVNG